MTNQNFCEVCKGSTDLKVTTVRGLAKELLGKVCICEGCRKDVFGNHIKKIRVYMEQVLIDRGEIGENWKAQSRQAKQERAINDAILDVTVKERFEQMYHEAMMAINGVNDSRLV